MYQILGATLMSVILSGCIIGGAKMRPDREVINENGETVLVTNTSEFERGVITAFPDIPLPSSHTIDLERSVIFTSPSQTVGKISMVGRGDVDSLFRFFERQMIDNGWNKVNAFQSATSSMYYAKPGRFVAIIIEADVKLGSRVTLNVGPE
ncbi:MAG: hypothetical protein OSB62_06420 [Alphaproteobacteria bacterium]|jgi:hypothetical protein|nr:hypothetical protein [Alphaproteobacteria bacterium]